MSSAKRKPRTPSPLEDEEGEDILPKVSQDVYAGRKVSISEFEAQDVLDCEGVASPGASSTSSEPTYVRQPGFEHHAHEVSESTRGAYGNKKVVKKKKSSPGEDAETDIPINPIPSISSTRPKIRKEPLPMKLRALPQSFWVQPNRTSNLPPSGALLPPLMLGKDSHDIIELRPVTPTEELLGLDGSKYIVTSMSPSPTLSNYSLLNLHHSPSVPTLSSTPSSSSLSSLLASSGQAKDPQSSPPAGVKTLSGSPPPRTMLEKRGERFIKVGNTDLLFSLFDKVEQTEKKKLAFIRRGRPKKTSSMLPRVHREEDPCMVGSVAEGILPLLTEGTPNSSGTTTPLGSRHGGHQVLEMVSLRDGDRTISLPSLNVEHNYSQILSELVMKL